MTDDIVTRLRKQMSNEFVIDHPNMVRVPTLYEQAADEIERLRCLLWKYENCEMVCESPCEPDWVDGECKTCTEHRKETRGER